MRATLKRDRGMALLVVLVLVILLSIMGAMVLDMAGSHYRLSQHQIESAQAFYLAEAGMVYAVYQMRYDPAYTGETLPLTDTNGNLLGDAVITIAGPVGGPYTVKSKVTY